MIAPEPCSVGARKTRPTLTALGSLLWAQQELSGPFQCLGRDLGVSLLHAK